jgi:hypothetical protein
MLVLNELYRAISQEENAHPEAALLVAGDFLIQENRNPLNLISTSMS